MGTNYYARIPMTERETIDAMRIAYTNITGKPLLDSSLKKLFGSDRGYKELHIGRQSGGWYFMFKEHPSIRTFKDWDAVLNKPGVSITNEYGEDKDVSVFMDNIAISQKNSKLRQAYDESIYRDRQGYSFSKRDFS